MQRMLRLKDDELKIVIPFVLLLAVNALVFEIAEVVATTGFISNIGTPNIILLWLVSIPITLLIAAGYSLIIDRVRKLWLMSIIMLVFTALYLLALVLFAVNAGDGVKYTFLYLLTELQYAIFPLAYWALVSDVSTTTQAKRIFPILATGGALGSVAGNILAAALTRLFPEAGSDAPRVLMLGALVFFLGFVLLRVVVAKWEIRARQSSRTSSLKENFREGIDVVREVPLFKYLALGMLAVGLGLVIIEFHFIYTLDHASQESGNAASFFQAFYGIYKALLIGGTLLFQSLIAGRYLERTGLQRSFFMLPIVIISGLAVMLVYPTAVGVGLGRLLMRVAQRGWDEPARKSALALVPDERRGRVSAIMENYLYAIASIAGSIIIGLLLLASSADIITRDAATMIYLALVGLAAVIAAFATWHIRRVYDKSLLNWRLSRSRRKSVLDGIEF